MNIKRVIREELSDFDWVEEISSILPKDRDWWIINDVDPYSLEVSEEIQDFVFKQGFTWMSGRKNFVPNKVVAISHRGGTYDQQLGRFGFYRPSDHSPSDIERYETGEDDLVYRWSEITKPIKESDDMDWIRDIKPTDPIGDFLMKKFHEKMVAYLSLGGRKGDIISREWATVEAFLIELRELKENGFVNFLSRILLQSHVDRPYPHILKAIEDSGFDVNKSEETKRLYKIFQSYNSLGNRIKRTLKKTFIRENDLDWITGVSKDYWDYYDAVVFNKKLSKDEFSEFINQALRSTQPANASDWDDDDEMSDLEYLNYRIRREGQAFIGKYVEDNGKTVLVYGLDPNELYPQVKDPKFINYEDI